MKKRQIGTEKVGELGLGCMGMSFAYGPADEGESLRVLERALDLGIDFWDTADMYGAGANESLLAKALERNRKRVFLATKFGNVFDRSLTSHRDQIESKAPFIVDGTPAYVRKCAENSLARLKVDVIDLYYQHRVDPKVPIEETVGAMKELVLAGKVRFLGLSEASIETIERAVKVHPITALQSEYSLWTRDVEGGVLEVCRKHGIVFVPYSPLGRGFLTGRFKSPDDLPEGDWRRHNPRFQGDNFQKNLRIVETVRRIAEVQGRTASQIALAWVLAKGEDLIPIPGTKRVRYLEENALASDVKLSFEEIRELDAILPPDGARYPAGAMAAVNR
jgi:aryl-alcohol dehydrogenase-like predicted oxidoreductase